MNKIEIIKKQFNDSTSDFEFKINRLLEKLSSEGHDVLDVVFYNNEKELFAVVKIKTN
jgi:hypothetical protein